MQEKGSEDIDFVNFMERRQSAVRRILKDRRRELRENATEAEDILWPLLQALRQEGVIIRRQHSVGPYITDFCCPSKKLIIEIDGGVHDEEFQKEYDEERTKYLNVRGYRVVRFSNEDVITNAEKIVDTIKRSLI